MKINEKILDIALLLGAVIAVIMALASDFTARCEEKRDNAFRLHILANSDSAIDQQSKYEVRDYIINDLDFIFGSCKTKKETLTLAERNLPLISDRVNGYLESKGCGYRAVCSIEKCSFETRKYGNYTLPAGEYDALKVTLGEGEGHNWWCVLFPTICVDVAAELPESLPSRTLYEEQKESAMLTAQALEGENSIEYRFRLYEWFKEFFGV